MPRGARRIKAAGAASGRRLSCWRRGRKAAAGDIAPPGQGRREYRRLDTAADAGCRTCVINACSPSIQNNPYL